MVCIFQPDSTMARFIAQIRLRLSLSSIRLILPTSSGVMLVSVWHGVPRCLHHHGEGRRQKGCHLCPFWWCFYDKCERLDGIYLRRISNDSCTTNVGPLTLGQGHTQQSGHHEGSHDCHPWMASLSPMNLWTAPLGNWSDGCGANQGITSASTCVTKTVGCMEGSITCPSVTPPTFDLFPVGKHQL